MGTPHDVCERKKLSPDFLWSLRNTHVSDFYYKCVNSTARARNAEECHREQETEADSQNGCELCEGGRRGRGGSRRRGQHLQRGKEGKLIQERQAILDVHSRQNTFGCRGINRVSL